MPRLIFVLDEKSGVPVWHGILPGNVLDINMVITVVNDITDTFGIEIDSLVLDTGYVSNRSGGHIPHRNRGDNHRQDAGTQGLLAQNPVSGVKDLISGASSFPQEASYIFWIPQGNRTVQPARVRLYLCWPVQ